MSQFFIGGNATLQAVGLEPHSRSKMVTIVKFSDGQEAMFSMRLDKGYVVESVDSEGRSGHVPTFLTDTGYLRAGFVIEPIDGENWIQKVGNKGGLKLRG